MFENFSILFQSLKGVGEKCNFAPATDKVLGSTIASLASDKVLGSTYYLKSSLINCLRLWFFRRVERTLLSIVYLTPTVNVGKMLYLYSIIKKATKKIENLFCSLPDSAMVRYHVAVRSVRMPYGFYSILN